MRLERPPALNDDPVFIEALAGLVERARASSRHDARRGREGARVPASSGTGSTGALRPARSSRSRGSSAASTRSSPRRPSSRSGRGSRASARDDVRAALEDERTLVKTWAMRGTLHLLARRGSRALRRRARPAVGRPGRRVAAGIRRHEGAVRRDPGRRARARSVRARRRASSSRTSSASSKGRTSASKLLSGWGALLKPSARRGDLAFGPNRGRNVTFVRPDRWLGGLRANRTARRRGARSFADSSRRTAPRPRTTSDAGSASASGLKRMLAALEDELVEVEVAGTAGSLLAADLAVAEGGAAAEVRAAPPRLRPVRRRLPAPLAPRRSRARGEDLPPAGLVLAGRARRRARGGDLGARAPRAQARGPDRAVRAAERR